MKKFFTSPIPYIFCAFLVLFCSVVTFADKKQVSAINSIADYHPKSASADVANIPLNHVGMGNLLGDFTVYGKSDTRDDDLILTIIGEDSLDLTVEYTIVGNDMKIFEEFETAFKNKYTSQTALGKLVCVKLVSNNDAAARKISSGIRCSFSIFFPTHLLSKEYYIVTADSPNVFKARSEDDFTMNENYVNFAQYTLYDENYVALIYNNAYKFVWIGVAAFVIIFGLAIFFKIRSLRKENPEYYARRKAEKQQQKYYKQQALNRQYQNGKNNNKKPPNNKGGGKQQSAYQNSLNKKRNK